VSKGPFSAIVADNKRIAKGVYRLSLEFEGEAAEAFAKFRPGQFAQLDVCPAAVPPVDSVPPHLRDSAQRQVLLRRPFSFCDLEVREDKSIAEVLYCTVGPASLRMTTLAKGDILSVVGPLGRGFWIAEETKWAVLVAGGMGAPPLLHLAKVLTAERPAVKVVALVGAKTDDDLPFEKHLDEMSQRMGFRLAEFARYGIESEVVTEDGSAGRQGLVTEALSEWLGANKPGSGETTIYTCGPEAMLAEVARIAKEHNIDCQVSMEKRMACGIGLCQSCAVLCRAEGSEETVYKLCCKDGPVFDSKEVVFKP